LRCEILKRATMSGVQYVMPHVCSNVDIDANVRKCTLGFPRKYWADLFFQVLPPGFQ
jgi:hypothetical protein